MGIRTWRIWSRVVLLLTAASLAFTIDRSPEEPSWKVLRDTKYVSTLDASSSRARNGLLDQIDGELSAAREEALRQVTKRMQPDPTVFRRATTPSFSPPAPGARGIAKPNNPHLLDNVSARPPLLQQGLDRLERADRLTVTWEQYGSRFTLLQIGKAFRLTTSPKDDPVRATAVTVIGDTAYIEDRGDRHDLPLVRFVLSVDDQFLLHDRNEWWTALQRVHDVEELVSTRKGDETTVAAAPADDQSRTSQVRFTIRKGGYIESFVSGDDAYRFAAPTRDEELSAPRWATTPDAVATTWHEVLADKRPDWTEPVVTVTRLGRPPDMNDVLASQCGAPPFMPKDSAYGPPPIGSVFHCQVNLADVPPVLGLPHHGLLQFFRDSAFDSDKGIIRFYDSPDELAHDQLRAKLVPRTEFTAPTRLTFSAGETARFEDLRKRQPRPARFRRQNGIWYYAESDPDLADAMAKHGIEFVPNDINMMGGHWDGNGATEEGFTRLFMISDDIGYTYWHVPTDDLASAKFDRVVSGWTD